MPSETTLNAKSFAGLGADRLAALLRAMIGFSLDSAKFARYRNAERHLQTCAHLAKRIESFGAFSDHDAFAARLRLRHGRKSGFWEAAQAGLRQLLLPESR